MLDKSNPRVNRLYFALGISLCFITFLLVRYNLYLPENLYKYWNSDNAIFVLMGQDILKLTDFPFFYWGGNYLGPFNNIAMAITQKALELFDHKVLVPHVQDKYFVISPFAAVLSTSTLLFSSFIFLYLGIAKYFNQRVAFISTFLMSVGSALLIRTSVRPLAPEVSLLLGALILWRGQSLITKGSLKNQFIAGFLIGFSWWMNQITVFVIAPLLFYFVSTTEEYMFFRKSYPWKNSFLLKADELNHQKLKKPIRSFLLFIYFILATNFLLGLSVATLGGINTVLLGIKLKIHNGFSPMKTSILIFLILQIIIWLCLNTKAKETLKLYFSRIRGFILGLAIGYAPVVLGRVLGLYEKGYKPTFKFIAPSKILPYWYKLVTDFFPNLLGLQTPLEAILLYVGLIILIAATIKKNKKEFLNYIRFEPKGFHPRSAIYGIVFFNLIYIFLCERSRNQYAYRYAILSMPVAFAFISSKITEKRKLIKIVSVLTLLLIGQGLYRQGREEVAKIESTFDIRPITKVILASTCEVIYTDYFWSYLLEYFTQSEKLFFVSRGFKRTPLRNINLINDNSKKCDFDEKTKKLREL